MRTTTWSRASRIWITSCNWRATRWLATPCTTRPASRVRRCPENRSSLTGGSSFQNQWPLSLRTGMRPRRTLWRGWKCQLKGMIGIRPTWREILLETSTQGRWSIPGSQGPLRARPATKIRWSCAPNSGRPPTRRWFRKCHPCPRSRATSDRPMTDNWRLNLLEARNDHL